MPSPYETKIAELRQMLGASYLVTSDVAPRSETRTARDVVFGGTLGFYREEMDVVRRLYWVPVDATATSYPDYLREIIQLLLLERLDGGFSGITNAAGGPVAEKVGA